MRGGGIHERCHQATELRLLYIIQFFSIFGVNVALNTATSSAIFLEEIVKDFGFKIFILHG